MPEIQKVFAYTGQYLQNYPSSLTKWWRAGVSWWCRSYVSSDLDATATESGRDSQGHKTRFADVVRQLESGFSEAWYRGCEGVGKPSELKGSHDEVAKTWKSWSYKFETWFCSQWPAGQQALDWARLKGDEPV